MHPILTSALAEKVGSTAWTICRRSLLVANILAPILVWMSGGASVWAWIFAVTIHGTLLVGLFSPNSNWLGPILTKLPTNEKLIWLTIDDGPSADTIPLAEMLGEAGVHATFFLKGKKLEQNSACLESLEKNGHTFANHTQNHPLAWFWIYPPSKVAQEIEVTALKAFTIHNSPITPLPSASQLLTSHLSPFTPPPLPAFRCPAGVKNPFLHGLLKSRGLTLVGWTVRAYDGVRCDSEASIKWIMRRLSPGSIVLVHEGKKDATGRPASAEFIRKLVNEIKEAGYSFV